MDADRELRDPELDALVREHSAETPPARIDAAILAAAHRAVRGEGRRDERALARQAWRWWMPLAAAAMVGVVVISVLPLAPITPDEASTIVSDSPENSRQDSVPAVPDAASRETAVPEAESSAAASGNVRTHDLASRRSEPHEPASTGFAARESRSPQAALRPRAQPPDTAGSSGESRASQAAVRPPSQLPGAAGDAGQQMTPAPDATAKREREKAVTPPATAPRAIAQPPEAQDRREKEAVPQLKSDSARPLSRATNGDQAAGAAAIETPSPASPARPAAISRDATSDAAASGQRSTKLGGAAVRAPEQDRSDAREPGRAEWIARIRALREDGKLSEAIRELSAFRLAFEDADARLPDDLRSWAQTIAR